MAPHSPSMDFYTLHDFFISNSRKEKMLKPTLYASLSISVGLKCRFLRQHTFVFILKDLFAGSIIKAANGGKFIVTQ